MNQIDTNPENLVVHKSANLRQVSLLSGPLGKRSHSTQHIARICKCKRDVELLQTLAVFARFPRGPAAQQCQLHCGSFRHGPGQWQNPGRFQVLAWRHGYLFLKISKVLSSEMYLAEIRLIRWVVIKERGAEVFWKNPHVPDPVTVAFNFTAPFRTVIGN
jgi:hypothetical protein